MDLSTVPRGELLRLIYQLQDEVKLLKAEIAELRSRLPPGPQSEGKTVLPSFVKLNTKPKAHERKKREHGYGRVLDLPTRRIFHSLESCTGCGGPLGKPSVAYTREVVDVPASVAEVTEHVIFKRLCPLCHKRVYPKVDFTNQVVGKSRLGVNLASLVTTLREEFSLPLNKLQRYLKLVYRLSLSEGEIVDLLGKTAQRGKSQYQAIKKEIRASPVVHADETGSRESGQNGFAWSFSTTRAQLLLYHQSRRKQVVREVLGQDGEPDAFTGVLVSDFYASYNEYQGFHQRCWVHLLRDIHELRQKFPRHPPLNRWAKRVSDLIAQAKAYPGPAPDTPPGLAQRQREEREVYFKEKLRDLCGRYLVQESPMSTLCGRITTSLSELFTFVRFPGVSSDNNKAERDIRHLVISRKISGGTRSKKGTQTKEVLSSLFGTWRLQGLNPLEQCRLLLVSSPCQEV